jgi:chloride channel protein, CIC family
LPAPGRTSGPNTKHSFALDSISLQREDQILLLLTLIIGAVVGLVVVAFILVTENLGSKLYPANGAAWRRALIPVAGSLTAGFFLARYFPNARGSGIPQTKTALFLRDGYISFRTVLGKFSMCAITLASGIALGREGPSVQVSAGIASVLGRRLGLSPRSVRALLPIGAAAALAAAFNTPIAAVLFTLEEVMGDMHAPVLGSIVLSSATSWMVLHLLLGDEPLFHVPPYQLVHPIEFVFYAVLGVVGGLVSVAFVKLLLGLRKRFLRMPKSTVWFQPVAGGLLVGLLGWFVPQVLGVGYGFVDDALNGKLLIATMALLVGLKLIATATCYASGNAGGIFGPSLFIGAMTGGAIGGVAHWLLPDYTASVGAYALVGMGAAFAGTIRVPLTSVIMIFEITRDYTIIVPLMIANMISYFISSRLQEEPIYEALQHQDGIHLPSGARAREDLITVAYALKPEVYALPATLSVAQALSSIDTEHAAWPVTDEKGLCGMVTRSQLEAAASSGFGEQTLGDLVPDPGPVEHLNEASFPHVHSDHSLQSAMQRLAQSGLPELPVVSRSNIRELRGTISVKDVLDAFAIGRPDAAAAAETKASPKLFAGVLTVLMAMALLMGFLNYFFRIERTNRASSDYRAAQELMQRGSYAEAVEQYRDALSASHSVDYRLALGLALVKAGHAAEAPIYLNEVLREKPGNGPANLGLAQAAAQEGRIDDAVSHYQRAIYGTWPEKQSGNRFQARIELIDMLAKAGRQAQAEAELLSAVTAIPQNDDALKKQVGRMLIDYRLPKAAENLFRNAAQSDRQDAGAWEGLGDAEFANGEYSAARDAYRASLGIDPGNPAIAKQADLCERILALDPDMPGLGVAERYRRTLKILAGVMDELTRCGGGGDKAAVQQAQTELARKKRPASYSDAADSNRVLALDLWAARPASCAAGGGDDALSRVMAKLGTRN